MSQDSRQPVPGLRSPRDEVEGLVYFGRMVDKLRLELARKLPKDYHENMGKGFDASCCEFLGVSYDKLRQRVREGGSDRELLDWCQSHGKKREPGDRAVWNAYLAKRGWRDDLADRLVFRKKEAGWEGRTEIQTFFDYIDADEGRV
jgi:gluconokinase